MRVLLSHSEDRPFEVQRFGHAWLGAGGATGELASITPVTAGAVGGEGFDDVAGVLLTGGPDVEPSRYGQRPDEGVELRLNRGRDALDLVLLARAEALGLPVLAVCYGCQIMNVFYGGTLIQDLERANRPGHRIAEPKDFLAHLVRRNGHGRLLDALPAEFAVNSRHHQAIGMPSAALTVAAVAPDDVIEAVELVGGGRFVLGVQWHPENLEGAEHVEIFRRFRAACLARAGA